MRYHEPQQLQPRRLGRLRDHVVYAAPAGVALPALPTAVAALPRPPRPPPPNPSPPPPYYGPAPPAPVGHMFVVVRGSEWCSVSNNGTCVTDGVGNHGNYERCTIRGLAPQGLYVSTTFFETETYWDYITIGGQRYSGTTGFANVMMAAQETFTWYTDGSVTTGGFEVCGSFTVAPPSPPPSPLAPVPAGQMVGHRHHRIRLRPGLLSHRECRRRSWRVRHRRPRRPRQRREVHLPSPGRPLRAGDLLYDRELL